MISEHNFANLSVAGADCVVHVLCELTLELGWRWCQQTTVISFSNECERFSFFL